MHMAISERAQQYHERMFPGYRSSFLETDPDFIESFDDRTRMIAILATLIGCQGIDEFRAMLPAALNFGVTPIEAKEIVYQSVAYLGIGRVFPFLRAVNEVLTARGVKLPLPHQAGTTTEDRLEAGAKAQVDIFGEGMSDFYKSGPEETQHINRWLTDNCFGDYYTRKGLDHRLREMSTFCFLSAQGGCERRCVNEAAAQAK
jgi:4-carboxymuconolactone decarboxylase